MPRRHLPLDCESFVHCISRVVDRNFIFGETEKRHFHDWMRRLEKFCGVQVVTFCLMSNHFHVLLRVPDQSLGKNLSIDELRGLLPIIYHGRALRDALEEIDRAEATAVTGSSAWLDSILERYRIRRHSASHFMKDLKQRFTRWYNRKNDRCGTLWENRFRSVLVEGGEQALLTMAAYIDLNPVRAGLVDDPKDYRWSGYGEAVAGRKAARVGLCAILQHTNFGENRQVTWKDTGAKYRLLLYDHGERRDADPTTGSQANYGLSREQIETELARGGQLTIAQILRCKLRYMSVGAVFGSEQFVDRYFTENRHQFGCKRKSGARKMRGANWGELRILRDLRQNPFG